MIAVHVNELRQFGCAWCGSQRGFSLMDGGGAVLWRCSACGCSTIALGDLCVSPIRQGSRKPLLQVHPFRAPVLNGIVDLFGALSACVYTAKVSA